MLVVRSGSDIVNTVVSTNVSTNVSTTSDMSDTGSTTDSSKNITINDYSYDGTNIQLDFNLSNGKTLIITLSKSCYKPTTIESIDNGSITYNDGVLSFDISMSITIRYRDDGMIMTDSCTARMYTDDASSGECTYTETLFDSSCTASVEVSN